MLQDMARGKKSSRVNSTGTYLKKCKSSPQLPGTEEQQNNSDNASFMVCKVLYPHLPLLELFSVTESVESIILISQIHFPK